ncbi:MAG: SDR family oxidoreductase [Hyphomicrobiales bacterium]|nr:SDR family oxidoreductase [Hyphomicrobiales bacterium]
MTDGGTDIGKVVVITGATSGIGRLAAAQLARRGMRLVAIARDRARGEQLLARLNAEGPGQSHRLHYADLSRLSEVKRVGREIAEREPRIDVLINNAGTICGRRQITEDGLERTFAINHAAPFVLTSCLRDRLIAATPARIVTTASGAHRGHHLDFSDLQMQRGYRALSAYGRSKLCNILFTRELARRLAGTGVTANCLHPGFVRTGLGQREAGWLGIAVGLSMLFAGRPERGAATIVHLATAPELTGATGGYYDDCRPRTPAKAATDDAIAARLWQETARLTGVEA